MLICFFLLYLESRKRTLFVRLSLSTPYHVQLYRPPESRVPFRMIALDLHDTIGRPSIRSISNYHYARSRITGLFPFINSALHSLQMSHFARDCVRKTDVGRNTKRKRKETSQQRSIYLVCLFLSSSLPSLSLLENESILLPNSSGVLR